MKVVRWHGDECDITSDNKCDWNDQRAIGRVIRTTRHPINADIRDSAGCLTNPTHNHVPFGSYHPGGANFVFADGHVQFLSESINFDIYQALSTYQDGETISGTAY